MISPLRPAPFWPWIFCRRGVQDLLVRRGPESLGAGHAALPGRRGADGAGGDMGMNGWNIDEGRCRTYVYIYISLYVYVYVYYICVISVEM